MARNPGVVKEYGMGKADWHKYPSEKPKEVDEYLVTVNCGFLT